MSVSAVDVATLSVNTIRTLSMDAVEAAKSGHPGTPMALAPVVYTLWNRRLRYDPAHPDWPARDRFVLSCGHASMLLYSVLHLSEVRRGTRAERHGGDPAALAIALEDIRRFRQWGSPCAGHPEFGEVAGIETTTGPLGQGVANSLGMAIAARALAARFDRPGYRLFGFDVYALCSDGDVMEGVGCEAASLAGHLRLDNLCWIYDDNRITIEGSTDLAFSEEVGPRFRALGWQVLEVEDANDLAGLERALRLFHENRDGPTLIIVRSVIGYGAPNKQNSHAAHGSPLGPDEVRLAKSHYGWPHEPPFLVPEAVREDFRSGIGARGRELHQEWTTYWNEYRQAFPLEAAELEQIWSGEVREEILAALPVFAPDKPLATRVASGRVLNVIGPMLPAWIGGSADLAPSNNTRLEASGDFLAGHWGERNLHFGVREHAMGAIANGLALCGMRPYVGTFFVFADYLRPALRLSSLMRLPVLYIFTHDSIGLGEDGPTHQPIEHLAACRALPGLIVFRPCDANEVAAAYRVHLARRGPMALVLTRQNVPVLDRSRYAPAAGSARGAYVLWESAPQADLLLIGTGSEVALALQAGEQLAAQGIRVRVVSMPSWELFEEQDHAYQESVLPRAVTARVAVEAGVEMGWSRYLGPRGAFVGMSRFGASAPCEQLYQQFGLTVEAILAAADRLLPGRRRDRA